MLQSNCYSQSQPSVDSRARRAAKRVDLVARKSRWRINTIDNHGGFQLVDPMTRFPQAGFRYDLSAEEVIEFCAQHS